MARMETARWWDTRRTHSTKPATYRCPLCGQQLLAIEDHMLLFPEGDHQRRRHAHIRCVLEAHRQGGMLSREEWLKTQPVPPKAPGLLARLRGSRAER
jgi:hypothetical protein